MYFTEQSPLFQTNCTPFTFHQLCTWALVFPHLYSHLLFPISFYLVNLIVMLSISIWLSLLYLWRNTYLSALTNFKWAFLLFLLSFKSFLTYVSYYSFPDIGFVPIVWTAFFFFFPLTTLDLSVNCLLTLSEIYLFKNFIAYSLVLYYWETIAKSKVR